MITWRFDDADLHALRAHIGLKRITIKEAPYLQSLSGVATLSELTELDVLLARFLDDVSDVAALTSMQQLELQECRSVAAPDDIEPLVNLRFLSVSDCGTIESLAPAEALVHLEMLYAWGSTRIADADLSPLTRLPRLHEIRMRDRREYSPRLSEIVTLISSR